DEVSDTTGDPQRTKVRNKKINLHSKYNVMATATFELINALRETATRLKNGAAYAWGNHGACNCGNLLQVVAHLSKDEILQYAHSGIGEWTELAEDYCGI